MNGDILERMENANFPENIVEQMRSCLSSKKDHESLIWSINDYQDRFDVTPEEFELCNEIIALLSTK